MESKEKRNTNTNTMSKPSESPVHESQSALLLIWEIVVSSFTPFYWIYLWFVGKIKDVLGSLPALIKRIVLGDGRLPRDDDGYSTDGEDDDNEYRESFIEAKFKKSEFLMYSRAYIIGFQEEYTSKPADMVDPEEILSWNKPAPKYTKKGSGRGSRGRNQRSGSAGARHISNTNTSTSNTGAHAQGNSSPQSHDAISAIPHSSSIPAKLARE